MEIEIEANSKNEAIDKAREEDITEFEEKDNVYGWEVVLDWNFTDIEIVED